MKTKVEIDLLKVAKRLIKVLLNAILLLCITFVAIPVRIILQKIGYVPIFDNDADKLLSSFCVFFVLSSVIISFISDDLTETYNDIDDWWL